MQIIAGEKKGFGLAGPGPKEIRPVSHLVRKALFDVLRQVVPESSFLDLFAGTGSVGLEALSRGASRATFVDDFSEAANLIGKNLEILGYNDRSTVCEMEVSRALDKFDRRDRRFEVVFLGPPYGEGLAEKTLKQLSRLKVAKRGGVVAVEVFFKNSLPDNFGKLSKIKERDYGQSRLVFYRCRLRSNGPAEQGD